MDRFNRKTKQLTLTMAALAIVAVAAVMLLNSGSPAQATTATLAPDGGSSSNLLPQQTDPTPTATPTPTPGPVRALPVREACSSNPATVVDSGHIALFDVYWNPIELELTNNPCPPTVTHVPGEDDGSGSTTPAQDTRSPSSISIDAEPPTIIHIPNSAKVDLNAADSPYDKVKYRDLWEADSRELRGTDSDGLPVGDGMVWMLPACPPDGDPSAVGLCISLSATLLNPADWDGDVEFTLDHVHQIDIDKQDPRYVLAYDVPASDATSRLTPLWNSSDVREAQLPVAPGGYHRPTWFFTDRGTYEFQVHITGAPDDTKASERPDGLDPVSTEPSVSSDVREYIIHVGAEADLSVEVDAIDQYFQKLCDADTSDSRYPLKPHTDIDIIVTAHNAGPEEAPNTKVHVTLPEGLEPPHGAEDLVYVPSQGTYDSDTGVWSLDNLGVTNANNADISDDPPTLTIAARVSEGTHGETLTTKATISASELLEITETEDGEETVHEYEVPVLDPDTGNDMAACPITVTILRNAAPLWNVMLMVEENTAEDTPVGDPLWVYDDDGDTLTLQVLTDDEVAERSLTPPGVNGADLFTHSVTQDGNSTGVQIAVASGASLDHETAPVYFLAMAVHDSKDPHSNPDDTTIDDVLVVAIKLIDVVDDPEDLTFSVTPETVAIGETATFTLQVHGALPEGATDVEAGMLNLSDTSASPPDTSDDAAGTYAWTITGPDKAGDVSYEAFLKYLYDEEIVIVESDQVTVSWTASN